MKGRVKSLWLWFVTLSFYGHDLRTQPLSFIFSSWNLYFRLTYNNWLNLLSSLPTLGCSLLESDSVLILWEYWKKRGERGVREINSFPKLKNGSGVDLLFFLKLASRFWNCLPSEVLNYEGQVRGAPLTFE